jgi:hypothetical protein
MFELRLVRGEGAGRSAQVLDHEQLKGIPRLVLEIRGGGNGSNRAQTVVACAGVSGDAHEHDGCVRGLVDKAGPRPSA